MEQQRRLINMGGSWKFLSVSLPLLHISIGTATQGPDGQDSGPCLSPKGQDSSSLDVLWASVTESQVPNDGYSAVAASVSSLPFSKLSAITVLSSIHNVLSGDECSHTPASGAAVETSQSVV